MVCTRNLHESGFCARDAWNNDCILNEQVSEINSLFRDGDSHRWSHSSRSAKFSFTGGKRITCRERIAWETHSRRSDPNSFG
jgi:hypothetical protein